MRRRGSEFWHQRAALITYRYLLLRIPGDALLCTDCPSWLKMGRKAVKYPPMRSLVSSGSAGNLDSRSRAGDISLGPDYSQEKSETPMSSIEPLGQRAQTRTVRQAPRPEEDRAGSRRSPRACGGRAQGWRVWWREGKYGALQPRSCVLQGKGASRVFRRSPFT